MSAVVTDAETKAWLDRAREATESLRSLRQRLLALHADLGSVRAALGVEGEPLPLAVETPNPTEQSSVAGDVVAMGAVSEEPLVEESSSFVWPPGRTPN